MTAEVAILNREAVAIAADSAATVSDQTGQKIFSSANKIFSLSKHNPVGVMIYGNAHFMGVPWEIIIKVFRRSLSDKTFETLKEYGDEFIRYLKTELKMFPESEQEKYASGCIYGYFMEIRNDIIEKVEEWIEQNGEISQKQIKKIIETIVVDNKTVWESGESNFENKKELREEIRAKYSDIIKDARTQIFEKMPFTRKALNALNFIATELFISFPNNISNGGISGIVITGFGNSEIFPSVISYSIEGMANNCLKYKEDSYQNIDYDNSAMVIPFAQMEMVQTFIDGISPLFGNLYSQLLFETIENYPKIILNALLNDDFPIEERKKLEKEIKKIGVQNLKNGIEKIRKIQYQRYVEPILKVVTFLPKNELAEMAESLVNLTCLRKKISMDDETVGGPVDVAVISKGDGLVWIKRKHYFEQNLNSHFFINYLNK